MANIETCKNGHPRTKENTTLLASGSRRCKVCDREANKRWMAKQTKKVTQLVRAKTRKVTPIKPAKGMRKATKPAAAKLVRASKKLSVSPAGLKARLARRKSA